MYFLLIMLLLASVLTGSMAYVYRFRGEARYDSLKEYLRKGWPIFAPLNCLLYLFTQKRAKRPIMDLADFPELTAIQDEWETVRDEAVGLYEKGFFGKTNSPDSAAYYDLGFRTFYKYGWSKFYLKWYGHTHASAREFCPKTVEILKQVPSVNGAMFSLLPAGSKLTRHLDPVACSMRYHLGLVTPDTETCFIDIDNTKYSWSDGGALLFDETYLHYAKNDSDRYRLILMCDVERPLHSVGRVFNAAYKALMRFTVVPNLEGDERGLISSAFSSLAPALRWSKALKTSNRTLYRMLKFGVNSGLILVAATVFAASMYGIFRLAMTFTT